MTRPKKPSVFDLPFQHGDEASKIVAAAERVGQALEGLLRRAARDAGLSPLQARVVLFLDGQGGSNRRAGRIARSLGVSAPTMTDALAALEAKALVARAAFGEDGRAWQLSLSREGRRMARSLTGWADPARKALSRVPAKQRGDPFSFLTAWIGELLADGIVGVARMCVSCRHFERDAHPGTRKPHHCRLLDVALDPRSLRVDCPEHEAARVAAR